MPLVIMVEKRNFRGLMGVSDDLVVIPWRFYRDNILRPPPGVDIKQWENVMAQLLTGLYLLYPSRSLLLEYIENLYQSHGFTGQSDQSCPNLRLLLEKEIKGHKYKAVSHFERYRENLENRVSGILRHCGEIFNCDYGIDLVRMLDTNVILEMDGLAREMKELVTTLLLTRIFMYRLAIGERTNKLKTIVMIDEGQDVFRRQSEREDIPSYLATLVAQARQMGCGICVGAQQCRDLTFSLMSSTAFKIGTEFVDCRDLDEFCRIV